MAVQNAVILGQVNRSFVIRTVHVIKLMAPKVGTFPHFGVNEFNYNNYDMYMAYLAKRNVIS